ncbi:hypothetical protein EJ04DRAFT_557564 [Polyplosphaeria fusca]|uniref:Uncharacterized protein n=1 Tax=Polyplosphaeria fusca TaxID=682080 RepID=A0A9P4QKH5_9PLEO|nr:hypothetical protein EJ04DRAFT_557564 [Polyplosphaeria fusca]
MDDGYRHEWCELLPHVHNVALSVHSSPPDKDYSFRGVCGITSSSRQFTNTTQTTTTPAFNATKTTPTSQTMARRKRVGSPVGPMSVAAGNKRVKMSDSQANDDVESNPNPKYVPTGFLGLPGEIRNRICAFAARARNYTKLTLPAPNAPNPPLRFLNLPHTCRQLRLETLTLFRGTSGILIRIRDLPAFLATFSPLLDTARMPQSLLREYDGLLMIDIAGLTAEKPNKTTTNLLPLVRILHKCPAFSARFVVMTDANHLEYEERGDLKLEMDAVDFIIEKLGAQPADLVEAVHLEFHVSKMLSAQTRPALGSRELWEYHWARRHDYDEWIPGRVPTAVNIVFTYEGWEKWAVEHGMKGKKEVDEEVYGALELDGIDDVEGEITIAPRALATRKGYMLRSRPAKQQQEQQQEKKKKKREEEEEEEEEGLSHDEKVRQLLQLLAEARERRSAKSGMVATPK